MKQWRLLVPVGVLAVAGGLVLVWNLHAQGPQDDVLMASGTVETTEVVISFRMSGTLRERPVDEGDAVRQGDLLAALDQREAAARLRQAEAAVTHSRARLQELEAGYRPQEIAEARAQVAQAQAHLANLRDEAQRAQALYKDGAISRRQHDQEVTAARVAEGQYQVARERHALLQEGYRRESIAAARAQLEEAQAAAAVARSVLDDMTIRSPMAGVVTRTHAEVGETAAAGRAVLTVNDLARPWVRVYIPESSIGKVRLGMQAEVRVDSFPDRVFPGQVTYVAAQAEFTPKNVQTQEERVKLVFGVDVRAENPDGALKPGMPADVYLKVADGTGP